MIGIYKIVSPSGKIYIGQSWDIERRWKSYKYYRKTQKKLYNSLNKYSYSNHTFKVIHELPVDITQESLDKYEVLYWQQYIDLGSTMLNVKEPGKQGSMISSRKEIFRYDLKGNYIDSWISISEASKKLDIKRESISCNLIGRTKRCKNFMFSYIKLDKLIPYSQKYNYPSKRNRSNCPIDQYDLDGNFIKRWKNQSLAAENLGIKNTSISMCITGNNKSSGGFIWKKPTNE